MSTAQQAAIAAYNAETKRKYTLSVERANERDVRDRTAVATHANEVLRLEGHDEIVWSDLSTRNVGGVLVYPFNAHGHKFIGYIGYSRWDARRSRQVKIEMRIAPWATVEPSPLGRSDGLYTRGFDRIYDFADFGEALLAHMYEHQMPNRLEVGIDRKAGRWGGGIVLDADLWSENVSVGYGSKETRIDKYERMLQRYRVMGGAFVPPPRPEKPVLEAAEAAASKPKQGLFCWSKSR